MQGLYQDYMQEQGQVRGVCKYRAKNGRVNKKGLGPGYGAEDRTVGREYTPTYTFKNPQHTAL